MAQVKAERLRDKIATLKTKLKELKEIEVQLNETPDKQISLTDPDARSMKTRGSGMVGYNVQAAVDAKYHLIVTHGVMNNGVDRDQLYIESGIVKSTGNLASGYSCELDYIEKIKGNKLDPQWLEGDELYFLNPSLKEQSGT